VSSAWIHGAGPPLRVFCVDHGAAPEGDGAADIGVLVADDEVATADGSEDEDLAGGVGGAAAVVHNVPP